MASPAAPETTFGHRLHEFKVSYPSRYAALVEVAQRLRGLPWFIVGGTAAFLHGLDIVPTDIELVTTAEGAEEANSRLKEFVVQPVALRQTSTYTSHVGHFRVKGVNVGILGELVVRRPRVEFRVPVTPLALARATALEGEGFGVKLAPVEDEVISAAMADVGRHRDHLPHWLRVQALDRRYLEARMEEMGIPPRLREKVRREISPRP